MNNMFVKAFVLLCCSVISTPVFANTDDDKIGAWYMYFFNAPLDNTQWGFQGDIQYRNWDVCCDLEQLLLRGGLTWSPNSNNAVFTFGYANITSGAIGSSSATRSEDRLYQEALLPQRLGRRVYLRHRFRYEQRWVDGQDFRTRFRYAIFLDVPLNMPAMQKGAWYLAFYNEVFLNGEREIGGEQEVEVFDRDRLYGAIGYSISDKVRLQAGYMNQYTDNINKGQIQLSLHQAF